MTISARVIDDFLVWATVTLFDVMDAEFGGAECDDIPECPALLAGKRMAPAIQELLSVLPEDIGDFESPRCHLRRPSPSDCVIAMTLSCPRDWPWQRAFVSKHVSTEPLFQDRHGRAGVESLAGPCRLPACVWRSCASGHAAPSVFPARLFWRHPHRCRRCLTGLWVDPDTVPTGKAQSFGLRHCQ